MKVIKLRSELLLISLSTILCSCSSQQIKPAKTPEQWGNVQDGLRMSISLVEWQDNIPFFMIQFENVGSEDTVLNLGITLANGKFHSPTKIRLKLVDTDNNIWDLEFSDKRYAGIAGRVDEYLVFLRKNSSYSIKLGLDEFWCPNKNQEFHVLKSKGFVKGTFQISATFGGAGFIHKKSIGEMIHYYWIGNLESNTCVFNVK